MPSAEQSSSIERPRTYRADPDFLGRECATNAGSSVVRSGDAWGTRWKHGPFRFERYTGDAEPVLGSSAPLRLVIWQPERHVAKPKGWMTALRGMSIGRTGYAAVTEGYARALPSHARRHLAHWRRQRGWDVGECDLGPFLDAYRRSTQDAILRTMFAAIAREKVAGHGDRVRFFAARREGEIMAGFACVDIPETAESLHLMSFIRPAARDASAGIGLMDHWFATASGRGIRWLDFGLFWRPGEPRSWKGFSRFKSQFVTKYVDYPTPYMRFAGRWGGKG
jgi:hypothetical protein